MSKAIDLTGVRFGKLTAIKRIGSAKSGAALWHLKCDCGGETRATTGNLRSGRHVSCACGLSKAKHGMHKTRLHRIWSSMKARCQNPKKLAYPDYGGRGIFVCDEWQKFIPFMQWATSSGYADNLQIDRTDNDGPYAPHNCQWVTAAVNLANRRSPRFDNTKFTLSQIQHALVTAGIDPFPILKLLPQAKRRR